MAFHLSGRRAVVPVGGAAVAAIVAGVLGPQAQGSTVTSNAQVASVDTVPAAAGALFQYLQDGKYTGFAHGDNPTAANWGVAECVGCHTSGRDFVLSNYPLR